MITPPRLILSLALLASTVAAQIGGTGKDGAFMPTANVTLHTTGNGGQFHYTKILIPKGVTVTLRGKNPAVMHCQGAVDIAGVLDASGEIKGSSVPTFPHYTATAVPGPGGHHGGTNGNPGTGPGAGLRGPLQPAVPPAIGPSVKGGSAAHATAPASYGKPHKPVYGSLFPLSFTGGSGGSSSSRQAYPHPRSWTHGNGGGGGGAVAILADGKISISGSVLSQGSNSLAMGYVGGGNGSGGTILLRSMTEVDLQGGTLDASTIRSGPAPIHSLGYIRIDSYETPPKLAGTIKGVSLALTLPALRELAGAQTGKVYQLRFASVPGDIVAIFAALKGTSIPLPPLGVLKLDFTSPHVQVLAKVPSTEIDPLAAVDIPIPADPKLIGVKFHFQGINYQTTAKRIRLTNNVITTIK